MSLLDYVGNDIAIWNEYEKLDAELHQSLLEIDRICSEFTDNVWFTDYDGVTNNKGLIDKEHTLMAVGAAWLWWILAVNLMQINIYHQNKNRLLICDSDSDK
jgi:hypothetical protein